MDDAAPRWLDDDEMAAWRSFVSVLIRLPGVLDAQLRRDAGLTHFDYQVLAMLSEVADRQRRMSELARLTDASLSRLSHAVARLEDRGWVARSADPDDGRTTVATLTDAGMAKLESSAPGHVAAVRRHVIDPLTQRQIVELRRIADRLGATLEPEVDPGR